VAIAARQPARVRRRARQHALAATPAQATWNCARLGGTPERRGADGILVLEVRRASRAEQELDNVARARIAGGAER
jgi:hypothetical protein